MVNLGSKIKSYGLNLSSREHEILELICMGNTLGDIAKILYLSPHTVITHKKNLIIKFKAKNIVHLGVLAERYGLLAY